MWTFNGITSLRAEFSFIIWNSDGCIVGKLADKIEKHKSETQGRFTPFNYRQQQRTDGKKGMHTFKLCVRGILRIHFLSFLLLLFLQWVGKLRLSILISIMSLFCYAGTNTHWQTKLLGFIMHHTNILAQYSH